MQLQFFASTSILHFLKNQLEFYLFYFKHWLVIGIPLPHEVIDVNWGFG